MDEVIIAAIKAPAGLQSLPTSSLPVIKDAGIYGLTLRPHFTQSTVYKKSSASPNCVATSKNHVFAAQSDKAVVHVYAREKGNQELTVPFGEKITALATAGDEGCWLVLGMESGDVLIWEIYNGRVVKLQQSHVQAVTSIAVDQASEYFLTGSVDSTVLVWNFASALAYSDDEEASFSNTSSRIPQHTLTTHRAPITGLVTGHSSSHSNFAISISEDQSALVWNISTGTLLRTYLLPAIPRALGIDPADRAYYVGYEDGSLQSIDFYNTSSTAQQKSNVMDSSAGTAPIQVSDVSRWKPPPGDGSKNSGHGSVLTLALSYDATKLLAGHENGKLSHWTIGNGRYEGDVCVLPGAITNIEFITPEELRPTSRGAFKLQALVKPRFDANGSDEVEDATFNGELEDDLSDLDDGRIAPVEVDFGKNFRRSLYDIGFPKDLLWEAIMEFEESKEEPTTNGKAQSSNDGDDGYISLDVEQTPAPESVESELEFLRKQIESLQNLEKQNFKAIRDLRQEREQLLDEIEWKNNQEREHPDIDIGEEAEDDEEEDEEEEESSEEEQIQEPPRRRRFGILKR